MAIVSFSVLNRNGVQDTIACVSSILCSSFQDFHIYLLDNGSTKPQEYMLLKEMFGSHPQITLHHSPVNLGFTGGNNYNLRLILNDQIGSRYVCLLNNDCVLAPNFLKDFLQALAEVPYSNVGVCGPIIQNSDGSVQSAGSSINLWLGTNPRKTSLASSYALVDCVSGSCFFIARELLDKVGLLDDGFFAYREESDYCMKVRKLGYLVLCLNISGITHKEETASHKKKPYYTYLMFRNRLYFLRNHATWIQYLVSWLVLFVYLVVAFPYIFGLGNVRHALKGIIDGVKLPLRPHT